MSSHAGYLYDTMVFAKSPLFRSMSYDNPTRSFIKLHVYQVSLSLLAVHEAQNTHILLFLLRDMRFRIHEKVLIYCRNFGENRGNPYYCHMSTFIVHMIHISFPKMYSFP